MNHLFTAATQPAHDYVDPTTGTRIMGDPRNNTMRCRKCGRRRWAKNLVVQAYYDAIYVWCATPCKRSRK